ncbi:MAG: insulinase family protein [Bacteroidales bacterium]|nr:insulinase family protein [Bacteroidales bacterium]
MKKILTSLLLIAMMSSVALAQLPAGREAKKSDLNAQQPIDKKVIKGTLDNGFTYYIRANKKPENRVQFRLVTNAGSILEDEAQRGLAHFCEHMAFNGTEQYPGNDMISILQKHGIEFGREINAYTSFDETVYYVNLPSDDSAMVEMGFRILDGWAGRIIFDSVELEKERGVINEERRGGMGAGERLREKTWPIMLKGSRYPDRLPIGLESVIMGFKRNDIVRFFHDWYRPDLQAVIIVGDIDPVYCEAKVKEYFSTHPKAVNAPERVYYKVPNNKEPLVAIATDKEATGTSLQIYWKHPKHHEGTVGDYRDGLVRSLVSGMLSERFSEICEKPDLPVMYAGAGYSSFLGDVDVFAGTASVKEGQAAAAAEMVLTELRRADQHGFLQTELDRRKESMLTSYARSAKEADKTHNDSHASEYTRNFLHGEGIPGIRQEWRYAKEFLPEITLEECNKLISDLITDTNMIFYLTAPEGTTIPTEQEALAIIAKMRTMNTEPWVDNYKEEPLFDKELPAVAAKVSKTNDALGYTEYTLPNGVRFVIKKTEYKADEIQVNSYAWGGTSLYSDEDFYMANSADGLIDDAGIATFSSSQLGKMLTGKIVGISPSIRQLSQGFGGSCSPKDLETLLQLVYLYYVAPRRDQESLDKNIDNLRNQIKFVAENPQFEFLKTFYKTAYPDSKRIILVPSEEQLATLTLDNIHRVYSERFHDASAQTFFFVGNVKDDDVALIAKYLGNLPCDGKQKNEKFIDRRNQFVKGVHHVTAVKGSEKQSKMIVYGECDFNATPENRMIVSQLSDAMEITALEVIREQMGGTYSPSVSVSSEILPKGIFSWQFYIECDPDNLKKIENAIIDIVKDYQKNGPDAETLAKVQEQMVINRGSQMQNNGYWMSQITASYQYNENRDGAASLDDFTKRVKKVTAKDIAKMAKKYMKLDNYVVVTLMPETTDAE